MIFIPSIYDLEYYTSKFPVCFCDYIVYASDVQAQAPISGSGSYSIQIFTYSADGLTSYEDSTAYFTYFFARSQGQDYFAIQLKTFTVPMCTHACWILRVLVTDLGTGLVCFDKYTERYCQASCCDVPRGIEWAQAGIVGEPDIVGGRDVPDLPPSRPADTCGNPLIRLTGIFQCVSYFEGLYFGMPQTLISGTYFDFTLINNFRGRIVARPREITRDVSYNCVLQRSSSARQFLLEGFEYFPAWKMNEIENLLHADLITVSDFITSKDYQYFGDTPFAKVEGARDCDEVFKLQTTLSECFIRQIFGCTSNCDTDTAQTFIIPGQAYGYFYDENFQIIGDYDSLLAYYRGYPGVTRVDDVEIYTSASCGLYAVFVVDGEGYIPTSFYFGFPTQTNRVFGQSDIDITEYCDTQGVQCAVVEVGNIIYEDMVCAEPVIGTITYSDIAPESCEIVSYGYWSVDGGFSVSSNYLGQIQFDIRSSRGTGQAAGQSENINGEVIGQISAACWPTSPRTINNSIVPTLPDGWSFVVDTNGFIYFYGTVDIDISYTVTVEFSGLIYNQ